MPVSSHSQFRARIRSKIARGMCVQRPGSHRLMCVLAVATWAFAHAALAQPVLWNTNGHFYEVVPSSAPICWSAARTEANSRGADLATITSAAEQQFIETLLLATDPPSGSVLIGLAETTEGTYAWITGEPLSYTRWYPGEPNNAGGIESLGSLLWTHSVPNNGRSGLWNDVSDCPSDCGGCDYGQGHCFVIEYPCPPMIRANPSATITCPSGTGAFTAIASGVRPFTYQWQIETSPGTWASIGNDPMPLPCGHTTGFGSTTDTLHLGVGGCPGTTPIHLDVRCIVSSPCGSVTTAPATLTVCPVDFDCDGTADFFDYDAFVNCFEGLSCPPGKTADFDSDGTVDFFDYDAFVVAFESGC